MINFYTTDQENVWTGDSVQIDPTLGLPRGTTTQPPNLGLGQYAQLQGGGWVVLNEYPVIQTIAEDRWVAIKTIRDTKSQQGGYRVGSNWFHSDTFSRTQQLGLVLLGSNIPNGLMWKTMQGTFVEMTQTLAQQVFAAAAAQDSAIFGYAEYLKAHPNLDINVGWPETYSI